VRFTSPRSLGLIGLVAALTVAGAAAAAGYAFLGTKRYDATAHLIVSPVSPTDPTYFGLGLLRDTNGKRTAAATAAVLLRSPQVADAVRTQLGLTESRDTLLSKVSATVVGGSDVVAVTAGDSSAVRAAQLANAFAGALVSQRTATFQSQLATAIRRAQEQIVALPPNQRTIGAGAALQQRLTTLQSLQGQPDPTLRPADQAEAPTSAAWPNRPLVIGAGAGLGLLVGGLIALVVLLRRRERRPQTARATVVDAAASAPPDRKRERELDARADAAAAREAELERRSEDLKARAGELEQLTADLQSRSDALAHEAQAREAEKVEAGRRDAERAAAEAERRAEEAVRRDAEERDRVESERREAAERARVAAERREAEERDRIEAEHREAEERERREAEERERVEAERREAEERERIAAERREAEERERAAALQRTPEQVLAPAGLPGVPLYIADALVNGSSQGHWNLLDLQRLVDQRGGEFPERMDEWLSYLFFLREYAEPDGTVPSNFDWLIEDEFAEIV
jgi:capsular polysaccharide biosynthesis protein